MIDDENNKGNKIDPLEQLEALAAGFDVRQYSPLYNLVSDLQDINSGVPSRAQWAEVVDLVMTTYKHDTVTLNQSLVAAKELATYMHAKKRPNDGNDPGGSNETGELTVKEVVLFKAVFNNEF